MVEVTVDIAPGVAATRNARRMGITFYNASTGGQTINLSKHGPQGLAAANREYVLAPGAGLAFLMAWDGPDIQNEWGAYASADSGTLVVGETAERDEAR